VLEREELPLVLVGGRAQGWRADAAVEGRVGGEDELEVVRDGTCTDEMS